MYDLKERTFQFALSILKFFDQLEKSDAVRVIGKQFVRSGTSVGANYRSASKARSKPDFISKITIVEEEADETAFWLELLKAYKPNYGQSIEPILKEAKELTAIFTTSGKTAKQNLKKGIHSMIIFLFSLSKIFH